jgi:hypothetical protein
MVSSIGSSGSWYSMPNWSASNLTATQDLADFYANAASDLTSGFSSAATNQLNGIVNLAADAAAKRLGVKLNSSSSSSSASASSSGKASTGKASTATANSAPTSAYTNIDQFLARLDGNPGLSPVSSSTSAPFSLDNFLGGLDKIAAGQNASAPVTPSGKNFSIDSYLASLDKITARPLPIVNVTA